MVTDRRPLILRLLIAMLSCALMLTVLASCRSSGPTRWEPERKIPFSPDDRAIAYTHRDAVYVARTQGDKHRKVFEAEPGQLISTPHWAPGQRGLLFAISDGAANESSGSIAYEVYFWAAPADIWTDDDTAADGDTVQLPERWTPGPTEQLFEATAMSAVQISADALFEWHPDGQQVIYLDTIAGRQSVKSFDRQYGTSAKVAPISNRSLAFAISPNGEYLQVAAADSAATELWVGAPGESMSNWRRIEERAGPRTVPGEELPTTGPDGEPDWLFDLRPQLARWSPDSRWLAHVGRVAAEEEPDDGREAVDVVLTPIDAPDRQQSISFPDDRLGDMHWDSGGTRLGFLDGKDLLIIEPSSGIRTELAGAFDVEQFIGWSKPGHRLAYLLNAESFASTGTLLPTGHWVRWAPAARHNLVVARHDGTMPQSRFNMMNIDAAQWGSQSAKLSFWATYLPTLSLLPPGDPAAVLDLDKNSVRWYPTDLAEYAHVGHYYLLNGEAAKAVDHYSDALEKVGDLRDDEMQAVSRNLHLWRGVAYYVSGNTVSAQREFIDAREHTVIDPDEVEGEWDPALLRALTADRDILSTIISMSYIPNADAYAREIISADTGMRRLQALCYLSLIHDSLGQHDAYTENLVEALLPALLASPVENSDELVDWYLDALTRDENINQLDDAAKLIHGASLAAMAQSHPEKQEFLLRAAMVFYHGAGDLAAETAILQSMATPE